MTHEILLGVLSGVVVSFMLGVVGGGGSILAIPLLLHVVEVRPPHMAIGISAVAAAVNALTNLPSHARCNRVKWRCAATFAASGIAGALAGSQLGKAIDGKMLLALFGVLMIAVGASMLRSHRKPGNPEVHLTMESARALAPRITAAGFSTGAASGFFGKRLLTIIFAALVVAVGIFIATSGVAGLRTAA